MTSVSEWKAVSGYEISTDPDRVDIENVHSFLRTAYWSAGIPRAIVERAIANSASVRGLQRFRQPGRVRARHH
jgi:hypothetical protein